MPPAQPGAHCESVNYKVKEVYSLEVDYSLFIYTIIRWQVRNKVAGAFLTLTQVAAFSYKQGGSLPGAQRSPIGY